MDADHMQDRPYTAAQLAERWGVSDTFVYDQIKAGRIVAMRLGGKLLRVSAAAVADYESAAAAAPVPAVAPSTRDISRQIRTKARLNRTRG
jgi:excisionase family DNA binding protein